MLLKQVLFSKENGIFRQIFVYSLSGLAKREIVSDINFDKMNPDAVKGGSNHVEEQEDVDKSEENTDTGSVKWFDPDSPLTPNSVDKLIEAVNNLNDVFGTF